MRIVPKEMPPLNLRAPVIREWIRRIGPKESRGGREFSIPLTHWPNGGPITYIGLMAGEIEKENPSAVFYVNGTRMVDYGKAAQTPTKAAVYYYQYDTDAIDSFVNALGQ